MPQGSAARGRDDKNFAAAPRAKYVQRIARYVAEKELLFRSPVAAWQRLGYGRGTVAGWEQREGCARAGAATASPRPRGSLGRVVGCKPPCEELLKSARARGCVELAGLPKSFLSPIGAPAEISHRVIFGYLDLKGQSLEYFGDI